MSIVKVIFKQVIHFVGKFFSTDVLARLTKQKLVVPVYHLISDEEVLHIKHLYSLKSVKQFRADLDYLLKYYTPINYVDLQQRILSNQKLEKNEFILTFDDGLREFHDVIAPILTEKGISAICFLNSDFIDNKALFFRYKASLLIEELSQKPHLAKQENTIAILESLEVEGSKDFKSCLLKVNYANQTILDELAQSINYSFDTYLREKQPYLTSVQIESLIQQGFYFGSHSMDHPEYQFIDLKEQIKQTKESTDVIVKKLNLTYKTFAFPFTDFGVSKEYFEQVNVSNKIVDVSFGCAGMKKDSYANHVQRIPFEQNKKTAKDILNSEYLYFMLKALINKNKIRRK